MHNMTTTSTYISDISDIDDARNMICWHEKHDGELVQVFWWKNQVRIISKASLDRNGEVTNSAQKCGLSNQRINELMWNVHTMGLEMMLPSKPMTTLQRQFGLYLIYVVNTDQHILGTKDLDMFARNHADLLDACNISYTPTERLNLPEAQARLDNLDKITTEEEVTEGFVAKPLETTQHPGKTLADHIGGYGEVLLRLDDAMKKKLIRQKKKEGLTLWIYDDVLKNVAPTGWMEEVVSFARGCVFDDKTDLPVCLAMPKFFNANSVAVAANTSSLSKLKPKIWTQLSKQPSHLGWLIREVERCKSSADHVSQLKDAIDSTPCLLNGASKRHALLQKFLEEANNRLDEAHLLVSKHEDRASIGKATAPPQIKSLAFDLLTAKPAELNALRQVVRGYTSSEVRF